MGCVCEFINHISSTLTTTSIFSGILFLGAHEFVFQLSKLAKKPISMQCGIQFANALHVVVFPNMILYCFGCVDAGLTRETCSLKMVHIQIAHFHGSLRNFFGPTVLFHSQGFNISWYNHFYTWRVYWINCRDSTNVFHKFWPIYIVWFLMHNQSKWNWIKVAIWWKQHRSVRINH